MLNSWFALTFFLVYCTRVAILFEHHDNHTIFKFLLTHHRRHFQSAFVLLIVLVCVWVCARARVCVCQSAQTLFDEWRLFPPFARIAGGHVHASVQTHLRFSVAVATKAMASQGRNGRLFAVAEKPKCDCFLMDVNVNIVCIMSEKSWPSYCWKTWLKCFYMTGVQKCTNSTEEGAIVPLLVFGLITPPAPPLPAVRVVVLCCSPFPPGRCRGLRRLADTIQGFCFPPRDVASGWNGRLSVAGVGRQ